MTLDAHEHVCGQTYLENEMSTNENSAIITMSKTPHVVVPVRIRGPAQPQVTPLSGYFYTTLFNFVSEVCCACSKTIVVLSVQILSVLDSADVAAFLPPKNIYVIR